MKLDPNSPAFPVYEERCGQHYGMSIRAEMASRIMAGMAADPEIDAEAHEVASLSVKWADALIAELNKNS